MPDKNKSDPLLELFKNLAGASFLLGALLYAAGWTSLSVYYRSFGLDIGELDVPFYHALIYSLPVLFHSFSSALVVLSLIFVLGIVLSIESVRKQISTSAGTAIAFIALLIAGFLLSMWGARVGRQNAQRDVNAGTSTLATVAIELEPQTESAGALPVDFGKLEFKYLGHGKSNYFLFRPFLAGKNSDLALPASNLEVFAIPDSRVRKIRIQRGVD